MTMIATCVVQKQRQSLRNERSSPVRSPVRDVPMVHGRFAIGDGVRSLKRKPYLAGRAGAAYALPLARLQRYSLHLHSLSLTTAHCTTALSRSVSRPGSMRWVRTQRVGRLPPLSFRTAQLSCSHMCSCTPCCVCHTSIAKRISTRTLCASCLPDQTRPPAGTQPGLKWHAPCC